MRAGSFCVAENFLRCHKKMDGKEPVIFLVVTGSWDQYQ
jgi:hypothetical protein